MTREEVLQSVVRFDKSVDELRKLISGFGWDWTEAPLARLTGEHLGSVLSRYENGELTGREVEDWANLIEVREDIGTDPHVEAAIFALANPQLEGAIEESIKSIRAQSRR